MTDGPKPYSNLHLCKLHGFLEYVLNIERQENYMETFFDT